MSQAYDRDILTATESEGVAALPIMAALADGRTGREEREQIRQLFESLARDADLPALNEVHQRVVRRRRSRRPPYCAGDRELSNVGLRAMFQRELARPRPRSRPRSRQALGAEPFQNPAATDLVGAFARKRHAGYFL